MTTQPEQVPEELRKIGRDGRRMVLVGMDGSTTSFRAATHACGLARREDCRLVFAQVISAGPWLWAVPGAGAALQHCIDEVTDRVRAEITQLTEGSAVPITFVSRVGEPARSLSHLADKLHADLVVVGASHRHWLGGSVATGLVRAARWPVVVVP